MANLDVPGNRAASPMHNHEAEFAAVNGSATFIFLVAVVAILIAVPLAIFG